MAELAGSIGANFEPCIATAVAIARGSRVTLDSSGTCAASDIGVRGDYITDSAVAASESFAGIPMQLGCRVAALASEATAIGDAAYSAASGKISKTSGGGAVLLGKWTQAASGDGVLGQVQLGNPA